MIFIKLLSDNILSGLLNIKLLYSPGVREQIKYKQGTINYSPD